MTRSIRLLLVWVSFVCVLPSAVHAQEPLTIGQQFIPVTLNNVVNYPKGQIMARDYTGKLVIFDFFATWCAPCVKVLNDLQNLQNSFGDRIRIIVVTSEPKASVVKLLQRNTGVSKFTLPVVTGDTLLRKYFPYETVSHEVWIDRDATVRAITGTAYVTAANIQKILNKERIDLPVKNDFLVFDKHNPVFELTGQAKTFANRPGYYSGFTGYLPGPGLGYFIKRDTANEQLRYNVYNASIPTLYSFAYNRFGSFEHVKRCVLDTAIDPSALFFDKQKSAYPDAWNQMHCFSYEAIHPLNAQPRDLTGRLITDLDFFFGFTSSVEKRRLPCLVLQVMPGRLVARSAGGINKLELVEHKGVYHYKQENLSLVDLVELFNKDHRLRALPLMIDETGFYNPVDLLLDIGADAADIQAWKKALNKYGIDMVVAEREVEVLVLRKK